MSEKVKAAVLRRREEGLLGELQSYVDERARRWAVSAERASGMDKVSHTSRMHEALAIGQQVAAMIRRVQS